MPETHPLDQAAQFVDEARQGASERLSTAADWVRNQDPKRVFANVERIVKDNPGPALAIAAVFGFVIGRALTRD